MPDHSPLGHTTFLTVAAHLSEPFTGYAKGLSSRAAPIDHRNRDFQQSQVDRELTAVVVPVIQHDRPQNFDPRLAENLLVAQHQTPVNASSSVARTWISWVTFNVRLSIPSAVEGAVKIVLINLSSLSRFHFLSFPDSLLFASARSLTEQLVRPEPFERFRPLVQRSDGLGICSIKHMPPAPSYSYQPNIPQHRQMLRNRRLLQTKACDNIADWPLGKRQVVKDLAPPRFGDSVECIRSRRCSRHDPNNEFPYGNM